MLSGGRVGKRVAARGAYFSRSGNRAGGTPADLGNGGGAGDAPAERGNGGGAGDVPTGQAAPPGPPDRTGEVLAVRGKARPVEDAGDRGRYRGRRAAGRRRCVPADQERREVAIRRRDPARPVPGDVGHSRAGSSDANGSLPVQVTFSAPPAARSPKPTLTPSVPGTWQIIGDSMVFTPRTAFRPVDQGHADRARGPQRGALGGRADPGLAEDGGITPRARSPRSGWPRSSRSLATCR